MAYGLLHLVHNGLAMGIALFFGDSHCCFSLSPRLTNKNGYFSHPKSSYLGWVSSRLATKWGIFDGDEHRY